MSELGAERRVQYEVDGAVDDHQQVAEVGADRQAERAAGRELAVRRDQVDCVEFLDGLRQLTDEKYDNYTDQHHRDAMFGHVTVRCAHRLTLHSTHHNRIYNVIPYRVHLCNHADSSRLGGRVVRTSDSRLERRGFASRS